VKAHLLYRERDFDLDAPLPWNAEALTRDLALDTLFDAMARKDEFVLDVCRKVVLAGPANDVATIRYRQAILKDCLARPAFVRGLYAVLVESMLEEKKHWWLGRRHEHPDSVLRRSIAVIGTYVGYLRALRGLAATNADEFDSEGLRTLSDTLRRELGDDYLAEVEGHLRNLEFQHGALFSARLGQGNKARDFVLHRLEAPPRGAWRRLLELLGRLFMKRDDEFRFSLHPRDESGARALAKLRERAVVDVAGAIGMAADHVHDFFHMLLRELAFYVGCLNLHERLAEKGVPTCFADPLAPDDGALSLRGIYDVCLALVTEAHVVGNDADADGKDLILVTGPNQGGKSTFLRSLGLAQLMMQAGLFTPGESFRASTRDALFTHFKREEDASMVSGKLAEELVRMSTIVDHVTTHTMILFNESFAGTNEHEGSEVARQIVTALLEKRVRIAFVTHQYELARGFYERGGEHSLFLRAQRDVRGVRTFKLLEGEPSSTSFGEDIWERVSGARRT
jgi:hypothetical protein